MRSGIDLRLETAQMVIGACMVLNNIALEFNEPNFVDTGENEDGDGVDDLDPEVPDPSEAASKDAGEAHREELLRHFQGIPPAPRRQH